MNTTTSQKRTIDDLVKYENVTIKSVKECEFSSRIKIYVVASEFLSYNLYVGKRGKTFETESGEYWLTHKRACFILIVEIEKTHRRLDMKPIMFFTDDITINTHSATNKSHLGLMSIGDFIESIDSPLIRVFELESGELHIEAVATNDFMTGYVIWKRSRTIP